MKDYQYSLDIMKEEIKHKFICPEIKYAFEASIEALEKQIQENKAEGNNSIIQLINILKRCNHGKLSNNIEEMLNCMVNCDNKIITIEDLVDSIEEELFCRTHPQ